jgi:methionyl-tRNA synthetase
MKIVTNSNNVNTLKLVVSSKVAKLSVDIEYVSPGKDSKDILPVLHVEGSRLFLPGAAAIFLLQEGGVLKDEEVGQQERLLEWEARSLYPVIVSLLQHKQGGDKVMLTQLKSLMQVVESILTQQECVGGEGLSVVDILVWCDLYPIFTDSRLMKEFSTFSKTIVWFEKLSKQPSFSSSVSKFSTGIDGCKTSSNSLLSLQGQALPPPVQPGGAADPVPQPSISAVSDAQVSAAKAGWSGAPKQINTRQGPRLPHCGERNILITSALPYVNNVPHLGNIVGCVLSADVMARFARLRGYNVLYVCGTDEYGTSTETKAVEEGLSPRQICDKYNKLHEEIYRWFNISFDKFGRTTTESQTKISQDIFWSLHRQGCTLQDSVDQLYCTHCERFLADRFVEGECPLCSYEDARGDQCDKCGKLINASELIKPRCKLCSRCPEIRTSNHLFLDLPKTEDKLNSWLAKSSEKWTNNARVIAKSWLKGGLQPRCITRDLKWGTPVPLDGFQDKVFYVWFDAPIGYISITAEYTEHWEKWWKNPDNVEYWQFMAKDNVPFHSVVFPSTLLGTGEKWTMVNRLMSTEYLNYEDAKFSKSRGVGVFGNDAQETGIPADVWRFYLIYTRPENQDSAFKWEDLMIKNNSELLANLGNFINRATKFTKDNFGSTIPEMNLNNDDWEMVARVNQELTNYINLLEDAREREAITCVFNISRLGNQLMQHNTPWKLVKGSSSDKSRAGTVVGLSVNLSCLLSVLVQPYLPTLSAKLQAQLAAPKEVNVIPEQFHMMLPTGHMIGEPSPLVEEIKPATIALLKAKYAGSQAERKEEASTAPTGQDKELASQLEKQVAEQGDRVRQLKTDKAEKAVIDVEVKKLIDLKKQLSSALGQPEVAAGGKKGKKK